jgi:antitoxin component YwqK of YwqJK toxin-antitoxin module
MVDGVADGVVREWHANGNVLRETPYRNGAVDGVVSQWNSEGKLLGQYTLSAGLGIQRKWNEDGTLSLEVEIVSEGCHRGTVWDEKGRARKVYLWNGRPVSKGRFEAKIAEKSIKP